MKREIFVKILPYAAAAFAAIGLLLLLQTNAAISNNIVFEAEAGQSNGVKPPIEDATASGGEHLRLADVSQVAKLPAQILTLTNWKLTLPQDTAASGSPDEITQPALATFYSESFFSTNSGQDAVIFTAPVGGATTGGSSYPRSELREMTADGSDEAAWNSAVGTHTLTVRQAITHVPAVKSHVVAAQIHDDSDDVIMVRLEGSRLFIERNGDEAGLLTANYTLGEIYTIAITAAASGINVSYQSDSGSAAITLGTITGEGWYFKVGCYTQSNPTTGDDPSDYGQVEVYEVSVSHT